MKYDFDVIIIGGGPAGIAAAREAAETGVKTALIEKDKIGGSCRWDGCVPGKDRVHAGAGV
jgi:pyruvate/2-oxoglutarate dehydrogenase complex dihydrolipoamide dehydrogenase (E3) component